MTKCHRQVIYAASILAILSSACGKAPTAGVPSEVRGLYGAARDIEGALLVGITRADFSALVRHLSTEILLSRDAVQYGSQSAISSLKTNLPRYESLLLMYHDSETIWDLELRDQKSDPQIDSLAAKYSADQFVRRSGSYSSVDFVGIKQAIWSKATTLQNEIVMRAYGKWNF